MSIVYLAQLIDRRLALLTYLQDVNACIEKYKQHTKTDSLESFRTLPEWSVLSRQFAEVLLQIERISAELADAFEDYYRNRRNELKQKGLVPLSSTSLFTKQSNSSASPEKSHVLANKERSREPCDKAVEIFNSVLKDLMRSKRLTQSSLSYFNSPGNPVSVSIILCVASICALQKCADENAEPINTLFPLIERLRQHLQLPATIYQLSPFASISHPTPSITSSSSSIPARITSSSPPLRAPPRFQEPPANSIEADFLSILHSFYCLIGQFNTAIRTVHN